MTKLLNIGETPRDRLFFDQYEYVLNFKLTEMSSLRGLNHSDIDRSINHRNTWKTRNMNFGGSWRSQQQPITDEQRADCHAMCDFFLAQKDYKLVISLDWAYVYSNDLGMLRQIEKLPYVLPLSIKRSVIDRPRNTIIIKSSEHEYRSYFRAQRITTEQKKSLRSFLENQEDVRIGPGLHNLLNGIQNYHYINDNCFVDHNGMGVIMMLNLIIPKSTRKTLKLIRDK